MKRQFFLFFSLIGFIVYCYTKSDHTSSSTQKAQLSPSKKVISVANSFLNTPYRAGGTSKSGMDCSGLVQTSFKEINIRLPRTSAAMSRFGNVISKEKIKPGDLLFFKINRLKGAVNHVGLVTRVIKGNIYFIHSTTKKGVIISSLQENYWAASFAKAVRVIE